MPPEIKLGCNVQDTITGFCGVVVGITEWLHGTRAITVQARRLKDGLPQKPQTFDEGRLEPEPTSGYCRENADDLARRCGILLETPRPRLRISRVDGKLDSIVEEHDPPELHEAIARAIVQALRAQEAALHAKAKAL